MSISTSNLRKRLLQGLVPALRLLPPRLATRLVAALGRVEYRVNVPLRRRFDAATARHAGRLGAAWDVPAVARALAGNHVRWHARDRLLDGLSDDRAAAALEVRGRAHLDEAVAAGRGAIHLFNHFGPFLMPAHWLVRRGYPLRWFTERPRHISKLVARSFASAGPLGQRELFISRKLSPSEGGASIRRAVRILGAGMIVQLAGDVRWTGPRTAEGRFLGRSYHFTTTWISLAALTGAPVLPSFAVMRPDGSTLVEFLPPYVVPPQAMRAGMAAEFVQRNLDEVERRVRLHPDNSGDYFFWGEPRASRAELADS